MFKQILQEKGLTQIKLAQRLEVTQALISKWVTGKSIPRFETMQKLAEVLECDLATITSCFVRTSDKR